MKIIITTIGSRGDVQPYVALGVGLARAGHQVTLSAPAMFAGLICEYGLAHRTLSVNPQEIMEQPGFKEAAQSRNPMRLLGAMFREGAPLIRTFLDEVYANCRGADAIVSSMIPYGAFDAAQKAKVPFFHTMLGPGLPTSAFATYSMPPPRFQFGPYNRFTHQLLDQSFWQFFRPIQNRWRKEKLGLPALPFGGPFRQIRATATTLLGYSPRVIATPPDWPASAVVTGYWFLNEADHWQPPKDLAAFLASGPRPIYVGFGSMTDREAGQITRLVLEAVRLSGQRCVLSSGWSGLGDGDLPEGVFRVGSLPHSWLFPRVAAVVHHGGAGTTAAGLRAGVPSILTPYLADQFFWAQRVESLGVGPRAGRYHELTALRLAEAIRQAVTDEGMKSRAAELGEQIRAEDGVKQAVEWIEKSARVRTARG